MWTFRTRRYQFVWYCIPEANDTFTSNLSVYRNHIRIYNDVQEGCTFNMPSPSVMDKATKNSSFYDMVRTAIKTLRGANGAISSDRQSCGPKSSRLRA